MEIAAEKCVLSLNENITILISHLPECKCFENPWTAGTVSATRSNVRGQSFASCDAASKSTTSSALQRAMIAHRIERVGNAVTASIGLATLSATEVVFWPPLGMIPELPLETRTD